MTADTKSDHDIEQFLTFELEGEAYGVSILKVQEIRGYEPVRKIPNTPEFVVGALNLRGAIVPIIDLRLRFGMPKVEYTPMSVVIVVCIETESAGSSVMGIMADAVSDVLDIDTAHIKASPNLGSKIDTRYMRGMFVGKTTMVMLLDVDKLLNPEDFVGIAGLQ